MEGTVSYAWNAVMRTTHRIAIETMCTSFGRTSLQRPSVPGNIGPYIKPTTVDERAFSIVELTNQIRMVMRKATPGCYYQVRMIVSLRSRPSLTNL
jgi:hypothetical protein